MLRNLLYFATAILLFPGISNAQNLLVNFDNYAGTSASTPAGIYIDWHSTSPASFYTSATNYGVSPPSYKFGNDSDFIVTRLMSPVDSIAFWVKGNGSPFSTQNELRIYNSADSISWNLIETIDSLPVAGTNISVAINHVPGYFKFHYFKFPAGGNLAFDDLALYTSGTTSLNPVKNDHGVIVYPSPTNGPLNIRLDKNAGTPRIEVFDMLGNKVSDIKPERKSGEFYTLDLGGKRNGFYFIRIQERGEIITRRVTLSN